VHWTFLTNHAHVLICIAADAEIRVRDIALQVGITERAVQRILGDLEAAGFIERGRAGRRNRYRVNHRLSLRHGIERHRSVRELLALGLPLPGRARRVPDRTAATPAPGRQGTGPRRRKRPAGR
jgi:DNA-binding Lrp family transcriptional regulator